MRVKIQSYDTLEYDWWVEDSFSQVGFSELTNGEQVRLAYAVERVARQMREIIKEKEK